MPGESAVLVGVDGSTPSRQAAYWAAREAASLRQPLRLVYAARWPLPELDGLGLADRTLRADRFRAAAARQLDEVVAHCAQIAARVGTPARRATVPAGGGSSTGSTISAEVVSGDPLRVLTGLAAEAGLLVLGSSGHSDVGRVLVGSSAAELARAMTVPVIVVRDLSTLPGDGHEAAATQRVVLGVDGSAANVGAIRFALDFAARHGMDLVAVHAWCDLPVTALAPVLDRDIDPEWAAGQARARLTEKLTAEASKYPEVPVRHAVSTDRPAQALLDHGEGAALLVVGRHGRGGSRMPLGSVSHAMLHYAGCPVAIVPDA
jgi:nucleotide-binding universal stress UspA family protein